MHESLMPSDTPIKPELAQSKKRRATISWSIIFCISLIALFLILKSIRDLETFIASPKLANNAPVNATDDLQASLTNITFDNRRIEDAANIILAIQDYYLSYNRFPENLDTLVTNELLPESTTFRDPKDDTEYHYALTKNAFIFCVPLSTGTIKGFNTDQCPIEETLSVDSETQAEEQEEQTAATNTRFSTDSPRVLVLNGFGGRGAAKATAKKLETILPKASVIAANAASQDIYPKTLLVNLTGVNQETVTLIANAMSGTATNILPDGESAPSGTDLLLILGEESAWKLVP